MVKFYVRPLELSYGSDAKRFVKLKLAKKLCGRNDISFSKLEIIKRDKAVKKKIIYIQDLKQIELKNKNNIKNLIKNLISKRKPYLGINLNSPRLFGILNITPDSFSDGGLYFKKTLAVKHAKKLSFSRING